MIRIAEHQAGDKPEECRYCHMPLAKWPTLSCIWREGGGSHDGRASRGRPASGVDDSEAISTRLTELKAERDAALNRPEAAVEGPRQDIYDFSYVVCGL